MAIIKFINSKTRFETLINYVTKKSKVYAVEGKDCLADSALEEMISVKKAFQKEEGGVCRKVCVNQHNPFYVKKQKLIIDRN